MSRLYTLLFGLLLLSNITGAQTTYTWVGTAVGDYQVSSNWSPARTAPAANDILAFNATAPLTIANVPNQTIGAVRILSGTSSVTLTTNVVTNVLSLSAATPLIYTTAGSILAGDLLTVSLTNSAAFSISSGVFGISPSTGGKISINSALTLSGGTLDFDVVGSGGTNINTGGSITYSSGTFTSVNASAITWANGANYYHAVNGASASSIPVSTWSTGSSCNITGLNGGTIAPTGFTGVYFSNVTWNCAAQAGNINLDFGGVAVNITGALTITSTGANSLRLSNAATVINAGAYSQTGGTVVLQSTSGTTAINVNTNFSHTGGTLDFAGLGSSGASVTVAIRGALTKGSASIWSSTSTSTASQMNIQFTGNSSQVVTIAGTWNAPAAGRCNIINNNTDAVGVSVNSTGISGSLRVTNINSALPATCTNGGNFTGVGLITYFGNGAGTNNYTLIYNGTAAQTASSVEFPTSNAPYNLTVSSAGAVLFPSSFSRTVPGTLTLTSGGINVGNGNTLSLTNASLTTQLVYTGGYITSGTLSRRFPTSGLPTSAATTNSRYPFGTGTNDRSISLYFSTAALAGGTGGDIAISHTAIVNATPISPTFNDNGSVLDKRTNSNWTFNTGLFDLGSGGTTISIKAIGTNIGSVDNVSTLRLTNATAAFGTLISTTGTTDAPVVGKSDLVIADINAKTLYIGSDFVNALEIVTFTWTGAGNTAWTNPANWTGGVGYPSAPTEVAVINTSSGNMPVISTGSLINVYQLVVGPSASLTMTGASGISVFDLVDITGTVSFASTSTFTYASSVAAQTILNLPYGNLAVSGSATKTLPAVTTVTGDFAIAGVAPIFGTGTFVYAAGTAPIQRVTAANYYNLTFTGNRGGNTIRLGNGVSFTTIDIANNFVVTASNYVANDGGFSIVNFSSPNNITIPGFTYGSITNAAPIGSKRTFDPLGSSDPAHVISCRSLGIVGLPYVASDYTTTGSKVKLVRTGTASTTLSAFNYYDFELAGDFGGTSLTIGGQISIAGTFTVSATNYNLNTTTGKFYYNGTGNQTITPFNYYDLWIAGTAGAAGTRTVTLPNASIIGVRNQLAVTGPATFTAGNGFTVTGSTVNFFTGSQNVPVLPPLAAGGNNYHNITVTGGSRILAGDMKLGGDLTIIGGDANPAPATLTVGNDVSNRTLTIAGNIIVSGTSASAAITSVLDLNTVTKNVTVLLTGNLTVNGTSQVATNVGETPGNIIFNGVAQQYTNTSSFKNGSVNFIVGNGTAATTLTLNSSIDLMRSATKPFSGSFTVATNSILNAGTKNITIGTDDENVGNNAVFNLNANATLITANTGIAPNTAIEGTATDGTTGTILAGTQITKNYDVGANYVLNGATVNPFPAAINTMANLTIGAPVSLNKAIVATATLDLASYTLTQANNNLQFSGLTSTTGSIYADKNSTLSISGTVGTVGMLRFATGGNTTGQFTINRPVTVQLNSDLTIEKTPLTGNFITGTASSVLDINGNTLTINGGVSGPGTLSGSNTSSLTLGGVAGTVSFTTGKRVLKNLSLVNSATAALGTALDITDGTGPGTEGTVSVTGTAVLTTAGNLTLKSGANGTSRVAPGATTGGYINGDVTVERYLPAIRAWHFLAAPTYGQTIKQSWQENQAAGVNPGTGYGTIITSSNAATWAANGFDFTTPGSSLMFYSAGAWQTVPATTAPITAAGSNKSYMLFTRGDRSITPAMGTGATPTPVMLRTKGSLFQGDQAPVSLPTAGQMATIGNNYASAIDFTILSKTNIDQSFSVWDPKIPGAQGLGAWVTFSASTPTPWVPVPGGGSYAAGVPNKRIESGQAFLVHTTAGSGNVIINEISKNAGSQLNMRPVGNNAIKSAITTNLYNMSTGIPNIADANIVVFSAGYSNAIDGDDAVKASNMGDNFGLLRNAQSFVVEARQPVAAGDTVFFNMKKIKLQPYRLEFIAENFNNGLSAFLEDKYLHTSTPVSMAGTTAVDFTVTSDAASAATDRFRIVFKSVTVLPVTFTSITAVKNSNGNAVEWKVENEMNISRYEVERSTDGVNFIKAGAVSANKGTLYNWLDAYPLSGDNFYRVKNISSRGTFEYSRIVKVSAVKGRTGYTVYPNPSTDGSFGLQMSNISAGIYTIKITNGNGQLIWKEQIYHAGGTATKVIHPSSQLGSGNYQLEVTDITGKSTLIKVMVL